MKKENRWINQGWFELFFLWGEDLHKQTEVTSDTSTLQEGVKATSKLPDIKLNSFSDMTTTNQMFCFKITHETCLQLSLRALERRLNVYCACDCVNCSVAILISGYLVLNSTEKSCTDACSISKDTCSIASLCMWGKSVLFSPAIITPITEMMGNHRKWINVCRVRGGYVRKVSD